MNWRKIVAYLNARVAHRLQNFFTILAGKPVCETNNKDKPVVITAGRFGRHNQAVVAGEVFLIPFGDLFAFAFYFLDSRKLDDTEGTVDITEAIIVAQPDVAEPAAARRPAKLVAADSNFVFAEIIVKR